MNVKNVAEILKFWALLSIFHQNRKRKALQFDKFPKSSLIIIFKSEY